MKKVWGAIFVLAILGLVGTIGYFGWQSMQEADRVHEQNALTAQQQADIDRREATDRQKQAAAKQAAEKCIAEANQQYVGNIEEARKAQFQSQDALDLHLKLIEDTRNSQIKSCEEQYTKAVEQSGLNVLPN
jgi:type II secretory pathway pseudopilin PulG